MEKKVGCRKGLRAGRPPDPIVVLTVSTFADFYWRLLSCIDYVLIMCSSSVVVNAFCWLVDFTLILWCIVFKLLILYIIVYCIVFFHLPF